MVRNRLKLLIYTHNFPPMIGGPALESYRFADLLSKLGHRVIVLAPKYSVDCKSVDVGVEFSIVRMFRRKKNIVWNLLMGLFFIFYTLIKHKPKIVMAMEHEAQIVCGIASLFVPMKVFMRIPGIEIFRELENGNKSLKHFLFMRLLNKSKKIIAISDYDKEIIIRSNSSNKDKVALISPFIPNEWFEKDTDISLKHKLRKEYKLNGEFILFTAGRLYPAKGHDMVIKSLPYVLARIPNLKYLITGDGSGKDRLQRLVNKLNLGAQVGFLGTVSSDELMGFYDLCDVFILASRDDGVFVDTFGIVFAEANARKKPVIGGKIGGVPGNTIIDGYNGLLVDSNNPKDIAKAVIKLFEDKNFAENLGRNGHKRSRELFSNSSIAKQLMGVMES